MKKSSKLLALLLAAAMTLSVLSGCGNAASAKALDSDEADFNRVTVDYTPTDAEFYEYPERTVVDYSEMSRDLYDRDVMYSIIAEMDELCETEGNLSKLKGLWNALIDEHDKLNTQYSLINNDYYIDNSEENGDRLTEFEMEATEVADEMCIVMKKVLESDLYGEDMANYINSELVVDDFLSYTAMTDRAFELQEEYSRLVQEYYSLYDEDDLDAMAELYLKILDNLIASNAEDGEYDTYAEYAYANIYWRDFAPDESEALYEWTKEYIVPYFFQVIYAINYFYYNDYMAYMAMDLEQDDIVSRVQPYVSTVSDSAAEIFEEMVNYHLLDIDASDTKNEGGYTTSLNYYGTNFIFSSHDGYGRDVETLIHEFGHFYEGCVNSMPVMYEYDCYDLCEIDSQGMEMLMMKYADKIYGSEYTEIVRLFNLYNMFSSIIDGCVFDEFQQKALAGRMDGTISTVDDLNDLFIGIEESYYGEGSYNWGEYWVEVPHSYESPFYYISYATSATAALGILAVSEENYDEAVDLYNELVEMGNDNGFMETLDVLGIPNPLTTAGQAAIEEGLTPYLDSILG